MKKIKLFIILGALSVGAVISSCNMDKTPYDRIPSEITTMQDATAFRTRLYATLKDITGGPATFFYGDFQSDMFNVPANYGNHFGWAYRWGADATVPEIEDFWYGMYSHINNTNFLIEGIEHLRGIPNTPQSDLNLLNTYWGESHLLRAFYHYQLVLKYCKAYDPATANEAASGVMLITEPLVPANDYKPRATLAEVYTQMMADIAVAEEYITNNGAPNSYYFNADIVQAFKARVALSMKDYPTAVTAAMNVINSGRYELTSDPVAFKGMWNVEDKLGTTAYDGVTYNTAQKELLMILLAKDAGDGPVETGFRFLNFVVGSGRYSPTFFPTQTSIDRFDADNDIRFAAYFDLKPLILDNTGSDEIYYLNKYPGNPALTTDNYQKHFHQAKPFRLAELYLIAAEANYFANNTTAANEMLNAIRAKRITNWTTQSYSGEALLNEIKLERFRELYAEGQRLYDLKRWGDGFNRGTSQSPALTMTGLQYSELSVEPNNFRFLWPIPKAELDINLAIKDQQNPGY